MGPVFNQQLIQSLVRMFLHLLRPFTSNSIQFIGLPSADHEAVAVALSVSGVPYTEVGAESSGVVVGSVRPRPHMKGRHG